jgi:hypothetical protein
MNICNALDKTAKDAKSPFHSENGSKLLALNIFFAL